MTAVETRISRFCNSTAMAILLAVAAVVMSLMSWRYWQGMPHDVNHSLLLPSPNQWFASAPFISFSLNIILLVGSAVLMAVQNRVFNIVHNYSLMFVGMFVFMSAATPSVATVFQGGTLLVFVILLCMILLMTTYRNRALNRHIYLASLLVNIGATMEYGFFMYLPILIMGMVQMRTLSLRSLVAFALAPIAAWLFLPIYAYCNGYSFHSPEFVGIFETMPENDAIRFLITVAFTLILGLGLGITNFFRISSYNAKSRAVNSIISVVMLITVVMTVLDITNVQFYVLLLNACTAFQVGHFVAINEKRRGYILTIVISLCYLGLWVWQYLFSIA